MATAGGHEAGSRPTRMLAGFSQVERRDAPETALRYISAQPVTDAIRRDQMSVASMTQLAKKDPTTPENALGLITAYIPSEAIAVYLGALGILIPATTATEDQVARVRLICFAIGLLVALVIAFANLDSTGLEVREAYRRRIVVAVLAAVGFAIYAAATPSFFIANTFNTISFTQYASVAALAAAPLMPVVAKALGVRE